MENKAIVEPVAGKQPAAANHKAGAASKQMPRGKGKEREKREERVRDRKTDEAKDEARAHASRRAVGRSTGRNLYAANIQDFRLEKTDSGLDKSVLEKLNKLLEKEDKPRKEQSPGVEKVTQTSFLHWKLANRYCSSGYLGDDLDMAMQLAQVPDYGPLAGFRWVYELKLADVYDERLDSCIDSRSKCRTALRGILVTAQPEFDPLIKFKFWNKRIVLPFDKYRVEQACQNLLITMFFLLGIAAFTVQGLEGYVHAAWTVLYALCLRPKRVPRSDLRGADWAINLAHLSYGKRQGIDGSDTLIRNKLRDIHLYPADGSMQLQNFAIRDYVLSYVLQAGLFDGFRRFEALPAKKDLDPNEPVEKLKLRNPHLEIVDRAYVGLEDATCDVDSCHIGRIDRESIISAAQSRIWKTPRPKRSNTEYQFMLGIAKDYAGATDLRSPLPSISYMEFAVILAERKGLTLKEKANLFKVAEEFDLMSEEQVLQRLTQALKKTSWFIKDEVTPKSKELVHRFIINPDLIVKLVFGAALHPVEEHVYRNEKLSEHLIKLKKPEVVKEEFVRRFEPNGFYLNTDYSRFECCIRKEELDIEFDLFNSFVDPNGMQKRIFDIVRAYMKSTKVLNSSLGSMPVSDIRLSGFPNTSFGNAIQNLMNVKLAERNAKVTVRDFMIEGDDGILKFDSSGDRDKFLSEILNQRFVCKSEKFSRGTDVGFCGMAIKDGEIVPTEHQWNKLNIITSKADLSDTQLVARLLARYVCYYYKFPSVRDTLKLKVATLYKTHPELGLKVHTAKVKKAFRDDWYSNQLVDDEEFYDGLKSLLTAAGIQK